MGTNLEDSEDKIREKYAQSGRKELEEPTCKICNKSFLTKEDLEDHNVKAKHYVCECGYIARSQIGLSGHKGGKHSKKGRYIPHERGEIKVKILHKWLEGLDLISKIDVSGQVYLQRGKTIEMLIRDHLKEEKPQILEYLNEKHDILPSEVEDRG